MAEESQLVLKEDFGSCPQGSSLHGHRENGTVLYQHWLTFNFFCVSSPAHSPLPILRIVIGDYFNLINSQAFNSLEGGDLCLAFIHIPAPPSLPLTYIFQLWDKLCWLLLAKEFASLSVHCSQVLVNKFNTTEILEPQKHGAITDGAFDKERYSSLAS